MKRGHIKGILLPRRAWSALKQDKILTLAQLVDIAPRIERVVPGIGGKAARMIREQLRQIVPPAMRPLGSDGSQPDLPATMPLGKPSDVPAASAVPSPIRGHSPSWWNRPVRQW
jgi:hypothetical protein